jgi:hypothetical protein
VNGMCRSNVIIYQNETKFEMYCNDKTESYHITENNLKVAINTITWVWIKSLIIHTVTFRSIVNVEKCIVTFFPVTFFSTCLVTFYPVTFFRLPSMYCIYNISFIEISCPPMKRQTIICISDFW